MEYTRDRCRWYLTGITRKFDEALVLCMELGGGGNLLRQRVCGQIADISSIYVCQDFGFIRLVPEALSLKAFMNMKARRW
jgi:hypothetical protein